MRDARSALVIGGGVNGLVCAAYLAKAGLKPIVLEARDSAGGCARTDAIAPGFSCPTLAHALGPLRRDVLTHLSLTRHGLSFLPHEISVANLYAPDRAVIIHEDPARTVKALRETAPSDAEAWPRFVASLAALSRVIGTLYSSTPVSVDQPRRQDLWSGLRTLRAFRSLGKSDAYRLLRWGPMAVADLVSECFTHEGLRAAVAADGIFGTRFGPWSAGSGMVLLLRAANEAVAPARSWFVRGGPGAVVAALTRSLQSHGGEVRTGARVTRVLVQDDRAQGVTLDDGSEVRAQVVVSAVDPRQTFLRLCDPADLAPEFLWRLRNYRAFGTVAKVNLALATLPVFTALSPETMRGRIRIAPELDYLERAYDHSKYGRYSDAPYIELTIPSLLDATLAPAGQHLLSAYVQFAPYQLRNRTWDEARDPFLQLVLDTLERYTPGLRASIVAQQVITPLDLERQYGLTGGHIFHGELALDQLLEMRPLLGWGQYRAPIQGLYLCGSGTHPGTGLTGGSGVNAAQEIIRDLKRG